MIIRVDKCTTFGIKKFSTCSMQFQPKLLINNELVPPVQKGASFRYLGRHFNFDMNNDEHMSSLKSYFSNLLLISIPYPFFLKINCAFIKHTFSPKPRGTLQFPISPKPG